MVTVLVAYLCIALTVILGTSGIAKVRAAGDLPASRVRWTTALLAGLLWPLLLIGLVQVACLRAVCAKRT